MTPRRDAGLSLIAFWKLLKGSVLTLLALVLGATFPSGRSVALAHRAADWLTLNVSSMLLRELAAWLTVQITPLTVGATTLLVALDGGLSLVQGFGLFYRRRWAAWLTVIATGLLIPFEVWHFVRVPRLTRFGVIAANAAIVAYLALRVRRAAEWRDASEEVNG